jgi:hypothetical protein
MTFLSFGKKVFLAGLLASMVILPTFVLASNYGLTETATQAKLNEGFGGQTTIQVFIGTLIGTGLSFVGVVFFILMLYGGFLWMTARGNEDQTSKAIGTITAGAIGMVIIMASYAITSFLFSSLNPEPQTEGVVDPSEPVPPGGFVGPVPPNPVRCCVYRDRANNDGNGGRWVDASTASASCQALCDGSNGQLWGCADISIPNTSGPVGSLCR